MAYAYNHIKVTFGGGIYNQDIWVCGLTFGKTNGNVGFEQGDYDAQIEPIANHIKAWIQDPRSRIPNQADLKWVKLAYIGEDGFYFRDADIYDFDTPVVGSNNSNYSKPAPQNTLVQTFVTSVRRGPGRFGRIYPPLNTVAIDDTGKVSAIACQEQAETTALLLGKITQSLRQNDADIVPIVASKVGSGLNAEIRGVTVGNVIDTQRSRRNAFVEDYSVTAPISAA